MTKKFTEEEYQKIADCFDKLNKKYNMGLLSSDLVDEVFKKSSSKSCVDDLAKAANYEAKLGFRLVSSVYDSKRKETFLFFERKVKDEED
ncbi:hypothetical protein LNP00_04065 [Fructobacillus sp. M158]|uniref:hypothetical protein n=1 Tax=Fructobacillus parabroussonetiae TaxID=2713174 RepID=UPI002009F85E|nr:hypothetical protein [Fructobacillus parabroussonetiae]MCK8617538.1 hypothetical protein [Fructobacillus parabroussonetiae]